MASEDRAARCHFYGGDAPAEQQDETVTVAGAKHAGVLGQGRKDVLGDLVRSGGAGLLVADVQVIAADQPHAQHNLRHAPHLSCAAGRQRGPRWLWSGGWRFRGEEVTKRPASLVAAPAHRGAAIAARATWAR